MDTEREPNSSLTDSQMSLNAWLNTDASEHDALDISTRCEQCQEDLNGPCYEHTDVKRIIFDKPPVPLAYSSLPDAVGISSVLPLEREQVIFAKQKIEVGTLFGPLIAPLVPLDELKGGPPRYTLWSEERQEFQAYDLSDDFMCNWIKFIRPSSSMKEANVMAYKQRGFSYLVATRDIAPSTEMLVYIKVVRSSSLPNHQLTLFVESLLVSYHQDELQENRAMDAEFAVKEKPAPKRRKVIRRKRAKHVAPPEVQDPIFNEPAENSSRTFEVSTVTSQLDVNEGQRASGCRIDTTHENETSVEKMEPVKQTI